MEMEEKKGEMPALVINILIFTIIRKNLEFL